MPWSGAVPLGSPKSPKICSRGTKTDFKDRAPDIRKIRREQKKLSSGPLTTHTGGLLFRNNTATYILHILAQQVIGKMVSIQWTGSGTSHWFWGSDVSAKLLRAFDFNDSSIGRGRAPTNHNCQSTLCIKALGGNPFLTELGHFIFFNHLRRSAFVGSLLPVVWTWCSASFFSFHLSENDAES